VLARKRFWAANKIRPISRIPTIKPSRTLVVATSTLSRVARGGIYGGD